MSLSKFIRLNIEQIASEWETLARIRIPAAKAMSSQDLSSRFKQVLATLASHLDSVDLQSGPSGTRETAAGHGSLRHADGFQLPHLVLEFGTMRECVLRLWMAGGARTDQSAMEEIRRFNQGLDQALAEAIGGYSEEVERSQHIFLAVLGHDLRSPLSAISMAGQYLAVPGRVDAGQRKVVDSILRGTGMMNGMIRDLVEYSRSRLGRSMRVAPRKGESLGSICQAAIRELQATHPECEFLFRESGDLTGCFDCNRMHQALASLLHNAVKQGTRRLPVILDARGDSEAVTVQVKNRGSLIPRASLAFIFEPLVPLSERAHPDELPAMSLGIGLFVARELVRSHGGTIEAVSSETDGTVFTLRFPRDA